MDDEPSVWRRATGGDPDAFGDLFDLHKDRVYGQALRLTRSSHDAEDVTALVFLEAWRRRDAVRVVEGTILPWLLVTTNYVAKNHARSIRRHSAAMASLPTPSPSPDFTPEVDHRLDGSARAAAARESFARLSSRDQAVVTLCIIEDYTVAEAAAALGIPAGTVKSRLSRAKRRLADSFPETSGSASALGGAR